MAYEQRFVITKTEDGILKGFEVLNEAYEQLNQGRYVITIKRYQKARSNKQNSFYHCVVIPYVLDGMVDAGFERYNLSNEIVHEMLKAKLLKYEMVSHNGEPIEMIKRTSELTTVEFMQYMEDIARWAATFLNIVIPEPNEQSTLNFNK